MRPADIRVGATYRARNGGGAVRTVDDIYKVISGEPGAPVWRDAVEYRQVRGNVERSGTAPLEAFAKWAGAEVTQ